MAFRHAHYLVDAPAGSLLLRVGTPDAALDALLAGLGCSQAAVITAANPRSRKLPEAGNALRNQRLRSRLLSLGLRHLPARARDPAGQWPDEEGLLVPGLARAQALDLAREFDQHALLWCAAGRPPELLWSDDVAPAAPLDQHRGDDGGQA